MFQTHYSYVYLIQSEKRLVITKSPIIDTDYWRLMDNNGPDAATLLAFCKIFCLGYIAGNGGVKVINNSLEFE